MVKEKRILSFFIGWLIIGFCILFIGINNVFAASYTTTDFTAQLYDNYGPTLSAVTTDFTNNRYQGIIPSMQANTSGAAWGISSPISLLAGHTYSLTVSVDGTYGGNIVLSTYNRIGIGSILNNAVSSYQQNSDVKEILSKVLNDGRTLQFAFSPEVNGSYIVFPFATSLSGGPWTYSISTIIIDDLGKDAVTQDQINNSLNNQTNELNNSIQNSTDTIINNQNQNNEELKDAIKDELNSCRDSVNILTFEGLLTEGNNNNLNISYNSDGSLNINGTPSEQWANIAYNRNIILQPGTYTFSIKDSYNFDVSLRLYYLENNYIDYTIWSWNQQKSVTFTLDQPAIWYYVFLSQLDKTKNYNFDLYLQLEKGNTKTSWEKPGEQICQNKIDETNDKLDETNQNLGNINNSLTDSSPTDMSGLGDSAGWLPPGPVDSILTLPLTMLNSLVSNLSNNSCQNLVVELPFVNENLTLPCVKSLYDKMGVTGSLFTTAGLIASAFILFNYLLNLYQWVDSTLTMRENTMPGYFDDNWGGGA